MSSATLASPRIRNTPPDLVRIAALSAALVIDLSVFLAASRPLPPMTMPRNATPELGVRLLDPPRPVPAPPPLLVPPLHHPAAASHPTHVPLAPSAPRMRDEGRTPAPPVSAPSIVPASPPAASDAVPGPPVQASLAYRSAPLSFPPMAIRQHMHGTVLLRVLVDEDGRPLQVMIEQSSGYPLLDRSAREQVLARWRFQPASVRGRAVRAWARVPVQFDLRGP